MMAVLLVGGLLAGSAFAQDGDGMTLSVGRADEMSLMHDFECWYEIDFEEVGFSPDVLYPMMTSVLYDFDVSASGGLSEGDGGKVGKFCTPHFYGKNCGSCNYWDSRFAGRIVIYELWCLGVRVYRSERCNKCIAG